MANYSAVIVECRPGVGGEEAKTWAAEILRMYTRFANSQGWQVTELDEGVVRITGDGAYQALGWETGVHRVQRVPTTERSGRIHTSTASVVVLPEVPEDQIKVRDDDLRWEFSRSGGPGGQNVNKVATAVRLLHQPTGIVVAARRERFQEANRQIALALLRARLWERQEEEKRLVTSAARSAIGRSMRAEKIRTYNFSQNRVTDHRLGKSWHSLDKIIDGQIGEMISALSGQ